MTGKNTNLTAAVEAYFADLRQVRASGGATGERSSYGPLANLLNAVGAALKPKVFCVGELADQGAGHPDFSLYAVKQVQKDRRGTWSRWQPLVTAWRIHIRYIPERPCFLAQRSRCRPAL